MKKPFLMSLATLLILSACWPPAHARDTDNIYTVLQQPISLPYLPTYSGAKTLFSWGKRGEKLSQKRVGYDLEYQVMEDPTQVLEWYKLALKDSGWKVDPPTNARSISANRRKERYGLSVTLLPPQKPKYKATLVIGYTMYKQAEEDSSTDSDRPNNGAPKAPATYQPSTSQYNPR